MTVEEKAVFWYLDENLSPEQKEKLQHLREELEQSCSILPAETGLADDNTLLRFLKARQWNVHRAAKMYQVSLLPELLHFIQHSLPQACLPSLHNERTVSSAPTLKHA